MQEQMQDQQAPVESSVPQQEQPVAPSAQPQASSPTAQQPQDMMERLKGTILEDNEQTTKKKEAYNTGILKLMYNKDTKKSIYQILQSGEPQATIPKAAELINTQMDKAVANNGKEVDLGTRINGLIFTSMELGNLGTAAGFFDLKQEDMAPIVQESLKGFVQKGLSNGTLDPIEMQQVAESLMTPEDKEKAMQFTRKAGLPEKPGVRAAMEMYAGQKVSKEKQKYMQRMNAMKQRDSMAAQQQQQQEQPQPTSALGGAMS